LIGGANGDDEVALFGVEERVEGVGCECLVEGLGEGGDEVLGGGVGDVACGGGEGCVDESVLVGYYEEVVACVDGGG